MRARDLRKAIGAFVVVLLAVVVVTAGAGLVTDATGSSGSTQPDAPAYNTSALLPTPVDDTGSVPVPDGAASKTVVIDAAHGNAVGRADLQPLVDALVRGGAEVRFSHGGSSSSLLSGSGTSGLNATLADADAYVVADPAAAYGSDEASAVAQFADNGGRVLLLGDTPSAATSTSSLLGLTSGTAAAGSGQPNAIAARRGMTFDADYLFDMTDNANNFQYVYGTPSGDGSTGLADGGDRAVFDAAVPVVHGETATTAIAAANVSRSSTRTTGTHAVVARNGNVAAIGDTWFLSPDGATVADNEALVGNVAGFLVSGTKTGRIATSSPRTGVGTGRTVSVGSMTTRPESAPSATNETNATA